jgi:DNA replication factor GINS
MATIYDETIEAWRREFHSPELQELRPEFFRDVAAYVRRLKEAQRNLDQRSLKAILLEEEMSRIERLMVQLVDRRVSKIWNASQSNIQFTAHASEKWAQDELSTLSRHYRKFKEDAVQGIEPSNSPEKKKDSLLLRFVKDMPSIIGVDLKTHGPFIREDIAIVPYENAESLIRQGTAVEIRTSG